LDLSFSEDQILLQDSAKRFLAGEYDYAKRQKILSTEFGHSPEIWRQFAELGWLALPFTEEDGGLGGGATETALLMQEFGAALVVEPYLPTVLLGGALLALCGDAAQRGLLQVVMAGEVKLAFADGRTGMQARQAGPGWVLEGRKQAVPGGNLADVIIIAARTPGGVGLFTVPAAAPGLDRLAYRAADGAGHADITLSGVSVAADALLNGTEDDIEAVLDNATVALCADAFGALSVLVDSTVEYAKTRSQFGRPIGQFQALQHRMAEMAVMREEARAALLLGIVKADAPAAERIRATSAAKAKIGRCARFIGQQAVQLHGGMGVTEELNIGAYFKRLISFEILFGNTDFHLRRYAALAASTDILSKSLLSAPQAA
jgi:alkylation response protein AidB-like acyl-CoA dehydrogenase